LRRANTEYLAAAASLAAVEIPYLSRKIHKCVISVRTLKQTIGGATSRISYRENTAATNRPIVHSGAQRYIDRNPKAAE
jgi:hypothetical protein